jgi:hypothetical protein
VVLTENVQFLSCVTIAVTERPVCEHDHKVPHKIFLQAFLMNRIKQVAHILYIKQDMPVPMLVISVQHNGYLVKIIFNEFCLFELFSDAEIKEISSLVRT